METGKGIAIAGALIALGITFAGYLASPARVTDLCYEQANLYSKGSDAQTIAGGKIAVCHRQWAKS